MSLDCSRKENLLHEAQKKKPTLKCVCSIVKIPTSLKIPESNTGTEKTLIDISDE